MRHRVTSEELIALLRCPRTGLPLERERDKLVTPLGEHRYPLVGEIPIVLADERSLFSIADYRSPSSATPRRVRALRGRLRELMTRAPSLSVSTASAANFIELARLLGEGPRPARLLVIGGGFEGEGYAGLATIDGLEIVESDVTLTKRTQLVCDAHDLPFANGTFDGVVCQAVLEHVVSPQRVVEEIHRVLVAGGLVYSEIPFMQQVHAGGYDFTRYTHVGHLLLYRQFEELRSGVSGGPAMALGWSLRTFLAALGGGSRARRAALWRIAAFGFFWLKYLDAYVARQPAGLDGAAGTFFLGRRAEQARDPRDIVACYRGAQRRLTYGGNVT